MPNHVTTRCIMTGPTEDIAHFCALLIRVPDEATEVTLDFDRIIPMPGILKGTGCRRGPGHRDSDRKAEAG